MLTSATQQCFGSQSVRSELACASKVRLNSRERSRFLRSQTTRKRMTLRNIFCYKCFSSIGILIYSPASQVDRWGTASWRLTGRKATSHFARDTRSLTIAPPFLAAETLEIPWAWGMVRVKIQRRPAYHVIFWNDLVLTGKLKPHSLHTAARFVIYFENSITASSQRDGVRPPS